MAKDHARVNLAIWNDDDWRDLSPAAQHLYLVLWTSPSLSYCGAGDWHPGRISKYANGWSADQVVAAAVELSAELFLIIDTDTDEYLLRSWVKHDGLWKTPNMAVSVANARAELASKTLRGVIVHELTKLSQAHPGSSAWGRDSVREVLAQKPIDPAGLEPFNPGSNPSVNPSANPWPNPTANPSVNEMPRDGVNPGSNPPPTPAPSTATTPAPKRGPAQSARGTRLDESWMPPEELIAEMRAECPGVDLQAEHRKFVDYWIAKSGKDATKVSWPATWRNWIRRAAERAPSRPATASGRPMTAKEQKILAAEQLKDNPNPSVLDLGGPNLRAIQGGQL